MTARHLARRVGLARKLVHRYHRSRDPILTVRRSLAKRYLSGDGIEIGALHNPLQVSRAARVKYVDRLTLPALRQQYTGVDPADLVPVDIVDDGERLATIPDGTQDFVIANHFLEHCQNPIKALLHMLRVLRPGGMLYLAVPDKRFTFDVNRPATPLEHVLRDYAEGPEWSKRPHIEEYVALADKLRGAEAEKEIRRVIDTDYRIHYHVWTQTEIFELLLTLQRDFQWAFEIEAFCRNGYENVFILRKQGPDSETPREPLQGASGST